MGSRCWIAAALLALVILATIPFGPGLRERLYRIGSPKLLAEVGGVEPGAPMAATLTRVVVGRNPVRVLLPQEGLRELATWTPPWACDDLSIHGETVACAGPGGVVLAEVREDGTIEASPPQLTVPAGSVDLYHSRTVVGALDGTVWTDGSATAVCSGPVVDVAWQRSAVLAVCADGTSWRLSDGSVEELDAEGVDTVGSWGDEIWLGSSEQLIHLGTARYPGPVLGINVHKRVTYVARGSKGLSGVYAKGGAELQHVEGTVEQVDGDAVALVLLGAGRLWVLDALPGRHTLVPAVALLLVVVLVWAWRRAHGLRQRLWFVGLLALSTWRLWSIREVPIEALHLLEYGLLGVVLFWGVGKGHRGAAAAVAVALMGVVLGCVDESLQWWHPDRVGDLRDVGTDGLATGVGALFGWQGLGLSREDGADARSLALGWGSCAVLAFAGFMHLAHGFGDALDVDGVGVWTQRLGGGPDPHVALVEDGGLAYAEFIRRYGMHRAPSAHEARVRLFRRDFWLQRQRPEIGCGEQAILEHAFPGVAEGTPFALGAAEVERCKARPYFHYRSPVGRGVVTFVGPIQWWLLALMSALLLAGAARRLR